MEENKTTKTDAIPGGQEQVAVQGETATADVSVDALTADGDGEACAPAENPVTEGTPAEEAAGLEADTQAESAAAASVTETAADGTGAEQAPEKSARQLHREKLKAWKKDARRQASVYLKKKHRSIGPKRAMVKYEHREAVKAWKESLKAMPAEERRDQKKAFRAFKHRANRTRTILVWAIVLTLVAALCVVVSLYFSVPMLVRVLSTQKYTDDGEAADAVRAAGYALSAEICDEGFVLLKNDDDFLPISSGTKLSVFGDDAYNFVYGGSGSAGADQSGATTLFEALSMYGIDYNETLDAVYRSSLGKTGSDSSIAGMVVSYVTGASSEDDWLLLSDEAIADAAAYSDTAIIVLSSQEVEGNEVALSLLQPAKGGTNRAQMIQKVAEAFSHVIVVVNSGNCMELGFLDAYDSIDAAVWVGSPGSQGCVELVRMLIGEVNPSGRTVDTWPVSIEAEPGYITYGDYSYTNVDGLHVMAYQEGIYVGYRYYETWFEGDEAAYWSHVVYPFGYGLSYTDFTEEVTAFAAQDDTISVTVKVTNTGAMAGKDVVELYFMAPWYEESYIEKSVIELGAYGKTSQLAPGESETMTLSIPVRSMASYEDMAGRYLLEHGDYRIVVGKNVHDAATSETYNTYTVAEDVYYTTDEKTGEPIEDLFLFSSGGTEGILYMSRADKEGTFPKTPADYVASRDMLLELGSYNAYTSPYSTEKTEEPAYGAENGLQLADMKGLAYDDPQWETFLDQLTLSELISLQANGGWHTQAIKRLGVPGTTMLDGPSGLNSMLSSLDAVAYPMETVISSSWNVDMAAALGSAVGDEANVYGVNTWYAPALNIHRTSIGGRNNEYYSEDPYLAGTMGTATVKAVQEKGVVAMVKHFVCNDTELNARGNITIWVDQQALREIYLEPFRMAVEDGEAHGVMDSFTRLGVEWCGGSSVLLNELLRREWGFDGIVSTDACLGSWMDAEAAAKNGTDLMLEMGLEKSVEKLENAYRTDPIGTSWSLRDCAHHILYTICNYMG